MLLRLAYLAVTNTFSFIRLLPMSDREKEIEILVLRRQLTILQRQSAKPAFTPADRFLLAGLAAALAENVIRAGESCVVRCRETTGFRLWLIMPGVVLGV